MWTLKQAIEISKRIKRCTYVCSLDASKDFDKVNRTILWKQLIQNKISPYVILSLINYYNDSFLLVNNNYSYSMSFKSTTGVKQGGKCSPKLFSIYLEPLLDIISQTETGILIDKIKIDIIAYADDILLVSSTKSSLQKCLDLVTKFGDFEIQFNPIKTHYIVFDFSKNKSTMKDNLCLKLSGLNIERVDSTKYLGMQLNEKYDDRINIKKRIKCSYVALAKLRNLEILTEKTDAYLKGHLYKVYIIPILTYGLETCSMNKTRINELERVENKIIRSIYSLPKGCRLSSLRLINNIDRLTNRLKISQIEFFQRLLKNEFTANIIRNLLSAGGEGDYMTKILEILDQIDYPIEEDVKSKCKYYTFFMNTEHNANKKNNNELMELQNIFKLRNGDKQLIFELLRYDKN
ncbi:unnamed protein product [Brachionus calyciflorus]|uniref:Reverse transcriptase domain-containing protein n=1 Tax=Brachionus calyciflorus TaxID=104777 RepID=A0A813M2E3_9BILA|nr:unnamed protein product [Brachionus calyciflorus]